MWIAEYRFKLSTPDQDWMVWDNQDPSGTLTAAIRLAATRLENFRRESAIGDEINPLIYRVRNTETQQVVMI